MDSLCASQDSRFPHEVAVDQLRLARRVPCRATHARQRSTTQLFREAGRRADARIRGTEALRAFGLRADAGRRFGRAQRVSSARQGRQQHQCEVRDAEPVPAARDLLPFPHREELHNHGFKLTLNWAF